MDSDVPSSPASGVDTKTSFRKPQSDAANRKYRRRSPVSGSSSSDGDPNHERSSSPIPLKEDDRRRKDHRRDLDRDSGRSRYGWSGDSDRHFDRQSLRSSHSYNRHDDYNRHDKHADDNEREHSKFSQRSGRNSRGGIHSDYAKHESEHNKSRDDLRDVDKFSVDRFDGSGHRNRDKERKPSSLEYQRYNDKEALFDRARSGRRYSNTEDVKSEERGRHKGDRDSQDEKRNHRRSLGDHKRERSPTYGDSKGYQNDSNSRRDSSRHRLKGASGSDPKELDGQMYAKEEKKKYDDWENNRHHERYKREPGEQFEDRTALTSKDEEFPAKKPKLFGLVGGTNDGKDVASKFTTVTDERQSSSSKQAQESVGNVTLEQDFVKDSDIDAAKVAAMKAAELVNRNLIGTGYMSTDQKKKLLWGGKKSTTTEETAHPWDTALFGDRERQEKFNKLMGLKGDVKVEQKPDNQDGSGLLWAEKQKELQMDLEKQYTAGLRRRDGRTVGLGL